jgi:hypothetical protein
MAAATTKVKDIDGGPPGGVLGAGSTAATTEVKDIDDGPSGGARVEDLGVPTINAKKRRQWVHGRCQSWRSGNAAPVEPAPQAGR